MITAREYLNKIRWGTDSQKEDYEVCFHDRQKGIVCVNFGCIEFKGPFSFRVFQEGRSYSVPFHRIRKILKRKRVVWERPRPKIAPNK